MSIGRLAHTMMMAKDGSKEAVKALKGIEFLDKNGKLKSADDALATIAEKFSDMPDGVEKTARAIAIFGRAGKQMIPLLNQGADGIDELREEARDLGLVLGDEVVKESEELNDNLKRLSMVTQGIWRQAIGPLIPLIGDLVKRFLEWRKENSKIIAQHLERFIGLLIKGAKALGYAFDFLVKNATALKVILGVAGLFLAVNALATAMGGLSIAATKAAWATLRAWLAAAAPFIAIGAIIAGFLLVFDDIRGYLAGEDSLYGTFKDEIDQWTKKKSDIWFVDALKDFIRYIQEAIEWLRDLDEVFGDGSKSRALADRRASINQSEIQRRADNQTIKTARQRSEMGLPLTKEEQAAIKRTGVSQSAFTANYSPSVATPELRSSSSTTSNANSVIANTNINIAQQPGQSNSDLAEMVKEKISTFWTGQLQGAIPGVK